jgi:uncharacterized protein (TIGR03000 family)
MYSVVLMMAMSSSADMPAIGNRGGGCNCGGCFGGCNGGGCNGGGRRAHGCHGGGCYGGGCYGGGYGGCYGGGWGGGWGSCYGGGYGGGCYGGGGFGGGCYGGGFGGNVISGGGVISGGCYGSSGFGGYMTPVQGTPIQGEQLGKPKDGKTSAVPAPATIIVSLPEDAALTVDDVATTSTGDSRTFVSPELQPGKDYHYNLKATVTRDGKQVVVEKRVIVHAGEITPATLTLPEAGVAQR